MILISLFCLMLLIGTSHTRWTQQQAANWYQKFDWSAGFNYAPSYAVNQIEMWESFNEEIIDKELGFAQSIGFSKLRVFLHIGPFITSPEAFIVKIKKFLEIASKHGHHMIPVLFDDCWKPQWQMQKQPQPVPGVHNSQWVQCPGEVPVTQIQIQQYIIRILTEFKDDQRIAMWDLYNQVGNSGKGIKSLPAIKNVFSYARTVNTSQPLSSGSWNFQSSFAQINKYIQSQSDVITFHAYCDVACTKVAIAAMKLHNRPVICTQYMARPLKSKFITHLPVFKQSQVWAINWGFVFGRTQTYYPWWSKEGDPVPQVWFHDVIKPDGTPFDINETNFIKNITQTRLGLK